MKPAFATTTAILVSVLAAGSASAQLPNIIQNTRDKMNGVSSRATAASNEALSLSQPTAATPSVAAAPANSGGAAPAAPAKSSSSQAAAAPGGKHALKAAPRAPHSAPAKAIVAIAREDSSKHDSASADGESETNEQAGAPDSKYNANGRRDPFVSPVVNHSTGGSGCSTGKKCLEIGALNLRGVVRSESGFIAVVSNGLNKAYFLRENDPVFNGYVMRITEDSIVFQETLQDRLGKTFTREVTKKITTPAV